MSLSGISTFTVTRDNLIQAAYEKLSVVALGETISSDQTTKGALALNMLMKAWEADGMPLWAEYQGYVLPLTGVNSISVGSTGDHVTRTYLTMVTTAATSAAGTSLTVASTTGITSGDYIGVQMSTGMFWTTVSGAPTSTVITLASGVTLAVASGARLYTYTSKVNRPNKVIAAYVITSLSNDRIPIDIRGKDEIFQMGNIASTSSSINFIAYDPQLTNGKLWIFPRFYDGSTVIQITYQTPFDDVTASGDNVLFPQEWFLALVYGLAYILAPDNGYPPTDRRELFKDMLYLKDLALSNGTEEGSLNIQAYGYS